MRDIARQLRTDFGRVPDLVDEYVVHTPRKEAIRAARQVSGVTHYLSLMVTGEADMERAAMYGVAIVCIDEVTDELDRDLFPDPIRDSFSGDHELDSLDIIEDVRALAADEERFAHALTQIAQAQDHSRLQLDDIGNAEAERITRAKGGWSARANLALVKSSVTGEQWDWAWDFGFLMQMLDDYLDQPKDQRQGLSTPYTEGMWDADTLGVLIGEVEEQTREVWGDSAALDRFFTVCRLHRRFGQLENNTPAKASWLVPWYL